MNLDNKGWGFTTMFLVIGLLLVFFLIAVFFIIRLYNYQEEKPTTNPNTTIKPNNGNIINNPNYNQLEKNLETAAITYVKTYYDSYGIDTIVVSIINLQEKNLVTQIIDQKDSKPCKGYVLVDGTTIDSLTSKAYLKCSNYTTNGYQDWRLGE